MNSTIGDALYLKTLDQLRIADDEKAHLAAENGRLHVEIARLRSLLELCLIPTAALDMTNHTVTYQGKPLF